MRIRGLRKKIYLLTGTRPELDRKALQAVRSFESVRQLLQKAPGKSTHSSGIK